MAADLSDHLNHLPRADHRRIVMSGLDASGRPYFRINGLDVDGALKRVANRWDFYDRLVSRFYADHLDFFDRYRHEEQIGNSEVSYRMLHSLKGISGTIGATDLYSLSIEAEIAHRGGRDDLQTILSKTQACLNNLLDGISKSGCFSIPR